MKQHKEDNQAQLIDPEITTIDSLLHSEDFALEMAKTLDAAYYTGVGQSPPPFLSASDDTASIEVKAKDEQVAISLAGFYALECGIGALSAKTNQKPTDLLQTIVTHKADSATVLLLNRFANATWKAGQPFRSLDRIKRPVFTVASLLSNKEVQKDYDQIQSAATTLLASMQDIREGSLDEQMKKLRTLLHDEQFAVKIAAPEADKEKGTVRKSAKEQKIATSVAGFYALECGLNYLVTTQHKRPSVILTSITDSTISKDDKQLLCRFANATWKAGQPFRGLNRITRDTFTPFYFLTQADVEKDWVQVKAAAAKVLEQL